MIEIIQFTDLHLFSNTQDKLLGINTLESFLEVKNLALSTYDPDCYIITGDLIQDSLVTSYATLELALSSITKPIYLLPGNHDIQELHNYKFNNKIKLAKYFNINNWLIILLDSNVTNCVYGNLDSTEIDFLENTLNENSNNNVLIAIHHPPVYLENNWLNNILLKNKDSFWQLITKYQQVKAIISGHIHQELHITNNCVPVYTTPSTCVQFLPNSDKFKIDLRHPGFRILKLHENGIIETQVIRLPEFNQIPKISATGYK